MGCEVGSINGRFKSEKQVECFIECFNSIMEEKEPWFEEDHLIGMDDFNARYRCELDIWGRFENVMDTALKDVVAALVKQHPSEDFEITYNQAWDNSGESYGENYSFCAGKLSVEIIEEDYGCSDDDNYDDEDEFDEEDMDDEDEEGYDDDEELVSEVIRDENYVFEYADGELKLISGEPDEAFLTAMGIGSEK